VTENVVMENMVIADDDLLRDREARNLLTVYSLSFVADWMKDDAERAADAIRALEAGSEDKDLFAGAACALDDVQMQARILMRRLNQLGVCTWKWESWDDVRLAALQRLGPTRPPRVKPNLAIVETPGS
jgi:hypothetical protein